MSAPVKKTRWDTAPGRAVTEMLARHRATQSRLARLLGVPRSTLNQMLTGRMAAWPDLERRAGRALGEEAES